MEQGEVIAHPQESALLQRIFQGYALGASYLKLVDELRKQELPYDADKPWNKNMVARMLENRRYLGEKSFPQLVSNELFAAAAENRSAKTVPTQRTDAQKVLRRLCGAKPTRSIERQVLSLLNELTAEPQRITCPSCIPPPTYGQSDRLNDQLHDTMAEQPMDEEAVKGLIAALAAAQYDELGNAEYETERLRRRFAGRQCTAEMDAALLRSAVTAVTTDRTGTVRITLKNGQQIGGEPE